MADMIGAMFELANIEVRQEKAKSGPGVYVNIIP